MMPFILQNWNKFTFILPLVRNFMSIARFISKKLISQQNAGRSQPIIWIAKGGIIVGMMMMIISVSLVNGFQNEIQRKLTSFGGHLNIHSNFQGGGDMSTPFERNDSIEKLLSQHPLVKELKVTAHLPAIIESKNGIQGVVLKGTELSSDTSYLSEMLLQGRIPKWQNQIEKDSVLEILVSQYQAQQLKINTGDKISVYFINNAENPQQQNYRVSGIYESGLEEFDHQMVFMSLPQVLKYAHFGIEIKPIVDSIDAQHRLIRSEITGVKGSYTNVWKWKGNLQKNADSMFVTIGEEALEVTILAQDDETLIMDSAKVNLTPKSNGQTKVEILYNGGASQAMAGSYEISLHKMDDMYKAQNVLYDLIPYDLGILTVTEKYPEIISWLNMLDINVIIIIVLMIAISIINMTSALLIIIIERQQMIGTLKALGMANKTMVQTFLFQAIHIISRGMIWGNILGLGLLLIQKQFQLITLDPKQYFVKVVPIDFNILHLLMLNGLVFGFCLIAMIIPAAYSTRIQPIKSIRFN